DLADPDRPGGADGRAGGGDRAVQRVGPDRHPERGSAAVTDTDLRPRATVEFRSAETLEVRHPERIIDVLAMPYERPTNRVARAGKQIVEVVSRGAFDGVEHRDRIRVYRDHDKTRTTGKVVELNP